MKQISNIKNNTAVACATDSLFKYVFYYHHDLGGNPTYPQVAYSQDFYSEKAQFRRGLKPELKVKWREFVEDIQFDDEVFKFYANVYPFIQSNEDDKLMLYYVGNEKMKSIRAKIGVSDKLQNEIKELCFKHQIFWSKIEEQNAHTKKVKCDLTPKFHPNLERLNGLNACVQYWKKHLTSRGLCEIRIYDNLMTTSQNLIKTIEISAK